jgi:uroporphyrinogen III methyltransferase / synthase
MSTSDLSTVDRATFLRGKTILVTRPKEQAGEFAELLEKNGAIVRFVPTIQIVPPASWNQFDDAVEMLETYDGIIFTSANAVRGFLQALISRGMHSKQTGLRKKMLFVVGEKTKEALEKSGYTGRLLPGVTNAYGLAEALLKTGVNNKHYLFARGNLGDDGLAETLRGGNAKVDEVTVYETIAPREEDARSIRHHLETERIDVITFFSPSAIKNLLAIVPREQVTSRVIAVIGASTESAAKTLGLTAQIVARKPTATSLAQDIVEFFRN